MNDTNNEILFTNENGVFLDIGLTSQEFAKARLLQYTTQPGIIASKINGEWTFENYYLSETDGTTEQILIKGNKFDGENFLSILNCNDKEKKIRFTDFVVEAIENSIEQKIALPTIGPVFTLVNFNTKTNEVKILFLPEQICERALKTRGEKFYSEKAGCYRNEGLNTFDAERFMASCYIYKAITDTLPYTKLDTDARSEDYYDAFFIPFELTQECKNSSLGKDVTFNLSKGSKDGRKFDQTKKLYSIKEYLDEKSSQANLSDEKKQIEIQKIVNRKSKKINLIRKIRNNAFHLKVFAGGVAFVALMVIGYFAGRKTPPTTIGMTSREVVETCFTGFNHLDVMLFSCPMKGKAGKNIEEYIIGFYTSGKTRQAYEQEAGTLTPAAWFHLRYKKEYNYWTFGLTNLLIDGEYGNLYSTHHIRKNKSKPEILKTENGIPLVKGKTASYDATYYMLHHETLEKLFVDKHTTHIEMIFTGKKWMITKFDDRFVPVEVNTVKFNRTCKSLIEQNVKTNEMINMMREEYPWLPTETEMQHGETELKEFFKNKYSVSN